MRPLQAQLDRAACCRLGKQASLFYDEVQRCLFAPPLAQHFDKSWTAHASVKAAVYDTEAQLQSAADLHSKDEIALEICRLQVGPPACLCWAGQWAGFEKRLQGRLICHLSCCISMLSKCCPEP